METLVDATRFADLLDRLAEEAGAAMRSTKGPWALVGIRSRGDVIAERLTEKLKPQYTGSVDITLYRDDLSEIGPQPIVRTTDINFPIDGTNVLLIDDVVMTGRSVRAAIQSLVDFGRPRCIRLLVLVDRDGRELPISPDFVGMKADVSADQLVEVRIRPTDPDDAIVAYDRPDPSPSGDRS